MYYPRFVSSITRLRNDTLQWSHNKGLSVDGNMIWHCRLRQTTSRTSEYCCLASRGNYGMGLRPYINMLHILDAIDTKLVFSFDLLHILSIDIL